MCKFIDRLRQIENDIKQYNLRKSKLKHQYFKVKKQIRARSYYIRNRGKIVDYAKSQRLRRKEYSIKYHRKHPFYNRDYLRNYNKHVYKCDCGGKYRRSFKTVHFNTLKHKKYLDNNT